MVARELHDDGTYSNKVFAPGYGEFFTAHGGEVEAMALAVPTDASTEPVPPELETLSRDAMDALDAVEAGDWPAGAGRGEADRRLLAVPAEHRAARSDRPRDGPSDEGPRIEHSGPGRRRCG